MFNDHTACQSKGRMFARKYDRNTSWRILSIPLNDIVL